MTATEKCICICDHLFSGAPATDPTSSDHAPSLKLGYDRHLPDLENRHHHYRRRAAAAEDRYERSAEHCACFDQSVTL